MTYKAMHWFQGKSGLPRDRFVSSLYFNHIGAGGLGPDISALMNGVMALFAATTSTGGAGTGVQANASIFSPFATFESDQVAVYDLQAPLKSPPVQTLSRIATGPALLSTPTGAPEEVSICLSFEAVPAAGVNQQRRRGRIFLGPLSMHSITPIDANASRPDPSVVSDILAALSAASAIWSPAWEWVVNSPKTGRQSLAAVSRAWVDNAWDTQRRRGVDPSSKTYWGV